MQTGFIPVSQGMHFIRGDGRAAHHFAEDIPGTNAIMRTNRLLAWRCKACEIVLFRYGRDNAKRVARLLETGEEPQVHDTDTEQDPTNAPRR